MLRNALLLGAAGGLLAITRFQDGALLLPVAAGELMGAAPTWRAHWRLWLGRWALGLAAFGALASVQLLGWRYLQGSAFSGPRAYISQGSFNWAAPQHLLDCLASPRHGLFYWHPALLLGAGGLLLPAGPARWKLTGLLAFATQLYIIGAWSAWSAGASFGHRMFISTFPWLALGAANAAAAMLGSPACAASPRRALWAAVGLAGVLLAAIAHNFSLIVQYAFELISRQGPVPFRLMLRNHFIAVPRLLFEKVATAFRSVS